MVGSEGFEPSIFTQEQHKAILCGFLQVTAPELRHPLRSANLNCLPSGARRHAWLDYDPALLVILTRIYLYINERETEKALRAVYHTTQAIHALCVCIPNSLICFCGKMLSALNVIIEI